MTYQDDVAERRVMLDTWLRDTATDLNRARRALDQLTRIDGPQDPDVSAGIATALQAITTAGHALARDPHAGTAVRAPHPAVVASVGAVRYNSCMERTSVRGSLHTHRNC